MNTNKTQSEQLPQDAVMQSVLKASDLRVGNLINVLNPNTGIWNVESTKGKTIMILQQEEGHYLLINNLKPIPITEEWLGKLGYDLISENHYVVLGHLIWKIEDRFYCDKNGMQLKYIHQLQNLYFALTGSELTVA